MKHDCAKNWRSLLPVRRVPNVLSVIVYLGHKSQYIVNNFSDSCFDAVIVLQATIGIDFLSKTMYLEDRTVSLS